MIGRVRVVTRRAAASRSPPPGGSRAYSRLAWPEGAKRALSGRPRLAEAARAARARAAPDEPRAPGRRRGGAMDVFGGEVRRRDVFPLLVLHLISREPAYGNRLIEEIEAITDGVISVNPNTIYPLLRDLEARGLIEGQWEHPDRRTRRFYSITRGGAQGVPAAGRRARAVPRLGDRVGDPDQARDLRGAPRAAGAGEQVSESVVVDASLAEVWDYYFDPRGWPAWVDGFGRVEASDGYPEAGGSLRWRSIPAGRGEVTEHVLEHEPRRLHRVAFRDPESAGELRTTLRDRG